MSEHHASETRCGTVEHRARAKNATEEGEKRAKVKIVLEKWGRAKALEEAALLKYWPGAALILVNQLEAELNEEREEHGK